MIPHDAWRRYGAQAPAISLALAGLSSAIQIAAIRISLQRAVVAGKRAAMHFDKARQHVRLRFLAPKLSHPERVPASTPAAKSTIVALAEMTFSPIASET